MRLTFRLTVLALTAVGGARINVAGSAGDATPFSVLQQLRDLGTQPYAEQDVLLVDGGGNDAADLIGAYLGANTDGGAAYVALLGELLSAAQVAQASGGGAQGAAVAEPISTLARSWVGAFIARLAKRWAGESRAAVVDFYGALNQWLASPAAFGLTNTTGTACPITGTDAQGLPTYSIQTCTEAVAAANVGPNWNTDVFSDNFHGTPRTNQLMGALVTDTLRARGWL